MIKNIASLPSSPRIGKLPFKRIIFMLSIVCIFSNSHSHLEVPFTKVVHVLVGMTSTTRFPLKMCLF